MGATLGSKDSRLTAKATSLSGLCRGTCRVSARIAMVRGGDHKSAQRSAGEARRSRAEGPRVTGQAPEGCGTGRSGRDARLSWETMLAREVRSIQGAR